MKNRDLFFAKNICFTPLGARISGFLTKKIIARISPKKI
tara:strand:- start:157 stop:273 length:117 start_codon:yes stop_codon:yes gene_type:complete